MKEFDIAIVGAGVAGMTAAIYGLRAKKSVIILEKLSAGGQILETGTIANYPGVPKVSGKDLAATLKQQVIDFGGRIELSEALRISRDKSGFVIETDDEPVLAKTVIIANGSRERKMGLPDEDNYISRGISYCATCDGALYRGKTVAVYGGGNTAAYSVLYLAGVCSKVFWIFRKPEPRAEKHLIERVRELKNVEVRAKSVIKRLMGDEKLTSVELQCTPANGEKTLTDSQLLELDALFVTIGREADNTRFKDLVELNEAGYIKAGEDCLTSCPGVFAAGDTRAKKLHQIVTATADGAVAANAAIDYINSRGA